MPFVFRAEDAIRALHVTGVQTCALPISMLARHRTAASLGSELPLVQNALARLGAAEHKRFSGHLNASRKVVLPGEVLNEAAELRSEERRVGEEWRRSRTSTAARAAARAM